MLPEARTLAGQPRAWPGTRARHVSTTVIREDVARGRLYLRTGNARILGPETSERYLVGTQFIELVKHGLAGTIGTTVDQLRNFGAQRAEQGHGLVVVAESGSETLRQLQNRANRRSSKNKTRIRHNYQQQSLFDSQYD